MKLKQLIIVLILLFVTNKVVAQNFSVSGKITSNKEAVPGVSVVVKGTQRGVSADLDGNYTIKAERGEVLQFVSIGFTTQEVNVTSEVLNVNLLSSATALDEVVVTALGIKRSEKALGYAVTELKSDELLGNTINPVAALQGKVAGVEIRGSDGGMFGANKIQIRGASTLKGGNQPIYVIDGVILDNNISKIENADFDANSGDYGNELKNLNSDDFESISVLKGAAATALYGSRGLNGAIVITTKGAGKRKGFGVSISQTIGFDQVYRGGFKRQMKYGQGAFSGGVGYGTTNPDGTYKKWDNLNQFRLNADNQPTIIGMTSLHYGPEFDGRSIEIWDKSKVSYSPIKSNQEDAYELGFNTNTNVAINGGNEITSFYASASYKNAKGIVKNNDFERYSFLIKGSHKISKRVDINGSISLSQSAPKNALRTIGEYFVRGNYSTLYNTKFFRNRYLGDVHTGLANNNYSDTYGSVPLKSIWFQIDNWSETWNETTVRPILELNVQLTEWARFRAEGNMNYYFQGREVKNLGMGYNNTGNGNDDGGKYEIGHNSKHQTTFAGSFTFDKAITPDFNIGGFLRGEYFSSRLTEQNSSTDGGLIIPGQYFLNNSRMQIKTKGREYDTKYMLAAVGAVNMSWRNQLFVDITGRNDWSSALVYPNKTGNYSYFYPSVSWSWVINETFDLPKWISLGKLRTSWAQVGNDALPYSIYSGYGIEGVLQDDGSYIYVNELPNKLYSPDLKPERKNSWEIGLDWRFLGNRLGFDATYYKENTKNQIMDIAIPWESGKTTQLINAGNIQNSGLEISLHTVPVRTKDWNWDLNFTYTRNKNKIIELHPNVADYIELEGFVNNYNYRVGSVAKVGGDYGVLMSDSKPLKNSQGQTILNWREDRRVAYPARSGTVEEVGKVTPDFLGSISSNLKYKNLSLRIGIDMRYGGHIASFSNKYGTSYGISETSLRYRDSENGGITWTSNYADSKNQTFHDGVIPEGIMAGGTVVTAVSGAKVDVSGRNYADLVKEGILEPVHGSTYMYTVNDWSVGTINSDWLNEVKYIALRDITLSYIIPKHIAAKIGARGLNVSCSARNLGYLYNSLPNKLNPESIRGNNSAEFRERSNSPFVANYIFTVGLDF